MKNNNIKQFNIKILIILAIILSIIVQNSFILADDEDEDDNDIIEENIINQIQNSANLSTTSEVNGIQENLQPAINSRRYVVYDRKSGLCIYGKNENKPMQMASTTKIMTAIIVLEKCKDLNSIISIDSVSAGTGGSRLGLKKDDKITVNDLLYGLLMRSGNDAAMSLAIYIASNKENFAKLMNEKARELGLENTHFVTPHGLDDPNHYTTAYELAKIADYALKNEIFAKIVNTQYTTILINNQTKELKNTNELLGRIDGVYGVKTGFTNGAGRCLVTAIKKENMDLIIVVLGADTKKDRGTDTIKLINYVTKNYRTEKLDDYAQEEYELWKDANEGRIYVNKGSTKIKTKMEELPIKTIITKEKINVEITSLSYIESPVEKNTRIGTVTIKCGDHIIEEVGIITDNKIQKRNIIDYLNIFSKVITE